MKSVRPLRKPTCQGLERPKGGPGRKNAGPGWRPIVDHRSDRAKAERLRASLPAGATGPGESLGRLAPPTSPVRGSPIPSFLSPIFFRLSPNLTLSSFPLPPLPPIPFICIHFVLVSLFFLLPHSFIRPLCLILIDIILLNVQNFEHKSRAGILNLKWPSSHIHYILKAENANPNQLHRALNPSQFSVILRRQ